jgi:hypothetical protein
VLSLLSLGHIIWEDEIVRVLCVLEKRLGLGIYEEALAFFIVLISLV